MLLPTQCLVPTRHELFATSSPIGLVTLAPLPTWQRCLHCLATCFCHLAFKCRLNLSLVTFRATEMLWFQASNMCSRHGGRVPTGSPIHGILFHGRETPEFHEGSSPGYHFQKSASPFLPEHLAPPFGLWWKSETPKIGVNLCYFAARLG